MTQKTAPFVHPLPGRGGNDAYLNKNSNDIDFVRQKLKVKAIEAKNDFQTKHPGAHKFFNERGVELGKIRDYSAKILGTGILTGSLLLSPPNEITIPAPQEIILKVKAGEKTDLTVLPQKLLVDSLKEVLPESVRLLNRDQEKRLEQIFEKVLGVSARASLEGEHLNTTYGFIGAEQHLRRYPGDSIGNHRPFLKEGIAPGLGAWGYFAKSKDALSKDLEETEKWYAVVQTLYLPDWDSRQPYLRDWYKYRKVLIVNTTNGNAVVAAIADSGPAAWTGKHFGGSPEVMEYLGGPRYKKGPVILFFVDDPNNKVALGPVDYNQVSKQLSLKTI